jgi:hypothetical protein
MLAPMPRVTVLILAPAPVPGSPPLVALLDEARAALAERHHRGFLAAGADEVVIRSEPPDHTPFGERLRRLVAELRPEGLVVFGAASLPLATASDRRAFVDAARGDRPAALANRRASSDALAIACAAEALATLPPDLDTDNALPRWLEEAAGVPVDDLGTRRRLAMDVDSPLDLVLLEGARRGLPAPGVDGDSVRARLAALRQVAADRGGELLVAGRTSSGDLRWIETHTRSRTRALIEERGLRTGAIGDRLGRPNRRPPRSLLGEWLHVEGPGALGKIVASLCDGALIDSRVLLANRLGADERGWPPPEDRFASDLLLAHRVQDGWLAELTASARGASVPVVLGGHSLVGPGIRLALGGRL